MQYCIYVRIIFLLFYDSLFFLNFDMEELNVFISIAEFKLSLKL